MTWIARKNCRRSKCRMIDLNFICHTRLRWKLVTYKVKNWIRYYFQNLFRHSDWAPFVLCVFFSKLYTVYLHWRQRCHLSPWSTVGSPGPHCDKIPLMVETGHGIRNHWGVGSPSKGLHPLQYPSATQESSRSRHILERHLWRHLKYWCDIVVPRSLLGQLTPSLGK